MNTETWHQDDESKKTPGATSKGLFLIGMFVLIFLAVSVWARLPQQTAVANTENVTHSTTIAPEALSNPSVEPAPAEENVTQPTTITPEATATAVEDESDVVRVSLPQTYQLAVSYGSLGPQLLAAGAIDYERFTQLYQQMGRPLSPAQLDILQEGSDAPIVIDFQNAHFLLNFFWAVGLANNNPILTEGPMMQVGAENIGRFASTGGWTLGQYSATELYAGTALVSLTSAQQARLEEVTYNVYRPCCNNHTAFADCNHGMAMLGLLELLASQEATVDEMFAVAKAVNGFWFPQQALQTAVFFKTAMNLDYEDVDPRLAVSQEVFSGSGYQQVNQWLAENNLRNQSPNGGSSCGVG